MEKSVPKKTEERTKFLYKNYCAEQARMIVRQYEVSILTAFQMISETVSKKYREKYYFP